MTKRQKSKNVDAPFHNWSTNSVGPMWLIKPIANPWQLIWSTEGIGFWDHMGGGSQHPFFYNFFTLSQTPTTEAKHGQQPF